MEKIIEILISQGVVGIVVAIALGAMCVIYKLTKWSTRLDTEHNTIVKAYEKTDKSIDDIRKDLSYIKGTLDLLTKNAENSLAKAHSPISLTDKGKEIADELNIDFIIDNNWQRIKSNLDSKVKNKNPYDIQQYCRETAAVEPEAFFTNEEVLLLKKEAYNKGLNFITLSIVPALRIRDRYMKEKGISIEDIDKHDPNK